MQLTDRIGHIEKWSYLASKHQGAERPLDHIRHLLIHDMEAPERSNTAESIAAYFAKGTVYASAHVNVDNDSLVQGVYDRRVAYAAPGANHDGWQCEIAGYARQTRAEWLDTYSRAALENATNAFAQVAIKTRNPLVVLSVADLAANHRGIATHDSVSKAFKRSSHWDPGPHFPMDVFMEMCFYWDAHWRGTKEEAAPPPKVDPIPPLDYEVAVVYKGAPDEGAARVLGKAHAFRTLSLEELASVDVGLVVEVGYGEGYLNIRGSNRAETAALVATKVCDKDWAQEVRVRGRELAAKRAKERVA